MAILLDGAPEAFSIWWPDWLYESMPFIYAVAGLVTMLHFDTPAGYGVGALLLLAALLTLKMRRDYRHFNETIRLARELIEQSRDAPDQAAE
jgi:hypothetical protein